MLTPEPSIREIAAQAFDAKLAELRRAEDEEARRESDRRYWASRRERPADFEPFDVKHCDDETLDFLLSEKYTGEFHPPGNGWRDWTTAAEYHEAVANQVLVVSTAVVEKVRRKGIA